MDRDKVRSLLNKLAYQAHVSQPELVGTADVAESELIGGLMQVSQNPDARPGRLVEFLRDRAGLLLPRGVRVYTFPHRTFQEYLAACHLTDEEYPDRVADLVRSDPNRWREVALLAGAKAARGTASAIWQLVEALCYEEPLAVGPAKGEGCWGALLAGQALVETADLSQVSDRNRIKLERVKRWLVVILEQNSLPALERVAAGQSLAILGDDRPRVGLRADGLPDIAWCKVPAGPFVMGSDKKRDKWAEENEQPQHEVRLPGYKISQYPVTNAHYQAFVDDEGYTEKWRHCWTKAGWEWKGDRRGPSRQGDVFDLPNHPVVAVAWYEAVAFCRWLTEQLRAVNELGADEIIRLPSEAEWEKAARGTEGRRYPWSDEADPERMNYGKSGIGTTSAVGCFVGGASPYGCQDMSGNVWEWGATKWQKKYPYKVEDEWSEAYLAGTDVCVLRGGAFNLQAYVARAARRNVNFPDFIWSNYGFRLVRAPIGSGS